MRNTLAVSLLGLLAMSVLAGAHPVPSGSGHYSGAGVVVTNFNGDGPWGGWDLYPVR